jgi:hypothetical protein
MYTVESDDQALEQAAALPSEALPSFAELMTLLEIGPWGGKPYNMERAPEGNLRTHVFGPHREGLVMYLILEDQRRVVVLRVLWTGEDAPA